MTQHATADAQQPATTSENTRRGPVFRPNVDIVESPQELTIYVDLPGARTEDVDLDFEKGVLTIRAKVEGRQPASGRPLLREYGVGDFERSFQIHEAIDANKITAHHEAGVLTLHLPKSAAVLPRKIAVTTNGQ